VISPYSVPAYKYVLASWWGDWTMRKGDDIVAVTVLYAIEPKLQSNAHDPGRHSPSSLPLGVCFSRQERSSGASQSGNLVARGIPVPMQNIFPDAVCCIALSSGSCPSPLSPVSGGHHVGIQGRNMYSGLPIVNDTPRPSSICCTCILAYIYLVVHTVPT
jgi:hypothetical protein